jgi:hypothetical protein
MVFSIQLVIQHSNKKIEVANRVITEGEDKDIEVIIEAVEAEGEVDRTLTITAILTTIGDGTKKLLEKSLAKMITRKDLVIRKPLLKLRRLLKQLMFQISSLLKISFLIQA